MSLAEKGPLLTAPPATSGKQEKLIQRLKRLINVNRWLLFLAMFVALTCAGRDHISDRRTSNRDLASTRCPAQPAPLNVGIDWDPLADSIYASLAVKRLSKSVQISTESFDDLPTSPSDPAYNKFNAFHHFLRLEFPKVMSEPLKHEMVNTHGHLFTWEGSHSDLQPILLMAHSDTVPVLPDTLDQWMYPPLEGIVTVNASESTPGTWLWGRGVSDCKNQLMGILGALERLVTEEFKPERTILVASGFDEEIGGSRGSARIAALLEERYGPDSLAFIVDEGFTGITDAFGSTVAALGMAEKGTVTVDIKVETLGGHSSIPPAHTGIGVMSLLLAELEANPFEPYLDPANPYLKYLSCLSEHAPGMPKSLRSAVKDPRKWPALARTLAASERRVNSFLATTQAIDLIKGGVKVNALPEVVQATVDHRIAFTSSVNATLDHVVSVLSPLARSLNFTFSAFGEGCNPSSFHITLSARSRLAIEPAPITASDTEAFELIAGTCKHVFGKNTIVSPSGMYANTDTRWFWKLSRNIYRFTPAVEAENVGQHTVNERISLNDHLSTTRFFYKLIRNSEGWDARLKGSEQNVTK